MDATAAPPNRRLRPWPLVFTAVVLAVVVLGGYPLGDALSRPAGPPVDVAGIVRVQPLTGWEVADRYEEPPGARLTRGSGSLDFVVLPFSGSPEELAAEYVRQLLEPQADRLSVSSRVEPVTLGSGLPGVRVAYVGTFGRSQSPIEGEVTAAVSPSGVGVVFDAWSPQGLLRYVADDMRTMIDRAEVA
jgi:hypothetical protein